ncbi:MAG TPA: response regulator [Candidatus Saccharimonadales bacterium]
MSQVLLIESDRLIANNLIEVLQKAGFEVNWQVDPQAALDIADSGPPGVIVIDLVLAGRGGIEFLYEFRSYPDWRDIPVVVFSSLSVEELKEVIWGFEHLNVIEYHYKPNTTLADLARTISRILQPASA